MSKKSLDAEKGITIRIIPKEEGYVGFAAKDGKIIYEVTNPTLYLSVAGQLRRFLDTGLSL